jgi:hypothetical protein
MKKFSLFSFVIVLTGALFISLTGRAKAATNYNNVIDDVVFDNANSMSISQINSFLNTFPNSCISPNNGFTAPDVTGYSPATKFQYGGNVDAGTIIYHAAQAYGINPQVLLVTLQKEQGLVVGDGGNVVRNGTDCGALAISAAMGYNCPDTLTLHSYSGFTLYAHNGTPVTSVSNTCVEHEAYVGFSRQVIIAAWQLTFDRHRAEGQNNWYLSKPGWDNSDDLGFCYSGRTAAGGPFYLCPDQNSHATDPFIAHSGQYPIDDIIVTIANGGTAAFYNYTPHKHGQDLFTNTFNSWFGSTHASGRAWQYVGQAVYADPARTKPVNQAILSPSTTYYLKLVIRNMGDVSWQQGKVNLGTSNPGDRNSAFCDSSWLSCNRAATLQEASVAPGALGTFEFSVKTPASIGTYNEHFTPLIEGQYWMEDKGQFWGLSVKPPTYSWQLTGQAVYADAGRTKSVNPTVLAPNTTYYARIKARNSGNATWTNSGGNPVRLATANPGDRTSTFCDNSWLSCNRPATTAESTVAPGEIGTFEFSMKTPPTSGNYKEYFGAVVEGRAWLNDLGLYLPMYVKPPTYSWQWYWQDAYTDSSKTTHANLSQTANNSRIYLMLQARNTGNTTWTNSGGNPVNLATASPPDRSSIFHDSSWLSGNRAARLKEASVAPGDIGTFEFWVTAPYKTDGTVLNEYFRPVVEGKAWMNDLGQFWKFTMQSTDYAWSFVGQGAYTNSTRTTAATLSNTSVNTTYYLRLQAKNVGGKTWQKGTLNLGTSNPPDRISSFKDSSWLSGNRAATLKETSVAPGQTGTFEFSVKTPAVPGDYSEYFQPVNEGVTWLNDLGQFWEFITH